MNNNNISSLSSENTELGACSCSRNGLYKKNKNKCTNRSSMESANDRVIQNKIRKNINLFLSFHLSLLLWKVLPKWSAAFEDKKKFGFSRPNFLSLLRGFWGEQKGGQFLFRLP